MQVKTSKYTVTIIDEVVVRHMSQIQKYRDMLGRSEINQIEFAAECSVVIINSIDDITDKVQIKEIVDGMNIPDFELISKAAEQLIDQANSEAVKKN